MWVQNPRRPFVFSSYKLKYLCSSERLFSPPISVSYFSYFGSGKNDSIAAAALAGMAREIQSSRRRDTITQKTNTSESGIWRLTEIARRFTANIPDLKHEPLINAFAAQIGYATPRVDVRGAVFHDGKLLFVRERADGGWTMLGDGPMWEMCFSQAAEREVLEEAGFLVKVRKLVGVYDANWSSPWKFSMATKSFSATS